MLYKLMFALISVEMASTLLAGLLLSVMMEIQNQEMDAVQCAQSNVDGHALVEVHLLKMFALNLAETESTVKQCSVMTETLFLGMDAALQLVELNLDGRAVVVRVLY